MESLPNYDAWKLLDPYYDDDGDDERARGLREEREFEEGWDRDE